MSNRPDWSDFFAPDVPDREIYKIINAYEFTQSGKHFIINIKQIETGGFFGNAWIDVDGKAIHLYTNMNPSESSAITELMIKINSYIDTGKY